MNLLALKDLSELLSVQRGARCPQAGQLRDQATELALGLSFEITGIAQQLSAHALHDGISLLLNPSGHIDPPRGLGDDMAPVDEGLRHVDAA